MYEYLLENLISYSQVDGNLRRTADRGLVSELYRKQMNALALKYFGVDAYGNYTNNKEEIVSYRCPYSGELIKDLSIAHLEHILPVSSNGGTVLFNCIPILDKVNLSKKDEPNLLTWWQGKGKEYFSYDRLERLIKYMLEAYTLAFKEPTEEELYDYDNSSISDDYIENDDLSINLRSKSNKIKNSNQNITYYQLLTDMINELSKNRDVSKYITELNNLKEQNIFGNIEEIEKVIKAVQTIFKEVLGNDSKKYLSYSLKIDMSKLLKSLKTDNYEQEIRKRFEYIQLIIKQNNITVNDFFENLQDIDDINLIYFDINKITEEQKNSFIENIKIGHNTKIMIFINMLKMAKSENEIAELLKNNSIQKFTTYKQSENGQWIVDKEYNEIGQFWGVNKNIIMSIIKSNNNLRNILNKLDNYYLNTLGGQHSNEGQKRRIEIFIDMLKIAKTEDEISKLLINRSVQKFKTYKQSENGQWIVDKEYNEIGQFWSNNRDKIMKLISQDEELKNKLDNYYMNTLGGQQSEEGKKRRTEMFIDMLKIAKTEDEISELLKAKSLEKFKTYKQNGSGQWIVDKEYNEIGQFWPVNKDKIMMLILQDEELKNKVDDYFINTRSGQQSEAGLQRRIEIFVDMIKNTKTEQDMANLLKHESDELFKTYKQTKNGEWNIDKEYGKIGDFWPFNKDKIMKLILQDEELKNKLDNYYMNTLSGQKSVDGQNRRINIFIKMLKVAKTENEISKLLKTRSEEPFKTYKQIKNGEWIIDKEYGKIGYFWSSNKDKIMNLIVQDKELIDKLDNYYLNTPSGQLSDEGRKRRTEIFIDMLKMAKTEDEISKLLINRSVQKFKTYKQNENGQWIVNKEYGEVGAYWTNNKDKIIIPQLFFSKEYSNSEYDAVRNAIMEFLNYNRRRKKQPEFKTIDEYIDTLDKTKKETKALIELRNSLLLKKEQLIFENQELNKELNTSVRRAI